jgi:hypothetical protein
MSNISTKKFYIHNVVVVVVVVVVIFVAESNQPLSHEFSLALLSRILYTQ